VLEGEGGFVKKIKKNPASLQGLFFAEKII